MSKTNNDLDLNKYIPILKSRAARAHNQIKNTMRVPFDDCLGEAYYLFCVAVQKYDPSKGASFSTLLFNVLRRLEYQILITNRMTPGERDNFLDPVIYEDDIYPDKKKISYFELSEDAYLLVSLILNKTIGAEYGTGRGKKLPGKRNLCDSMKKMYGWSIKKTESTIKEIKDWWKDQL